MIAINKLRGLMAEKGFTQGSMAKVLGISGKTMGEKLKKGVFNSTEMQKMVVVLEIEDPASVFFAKDIP